MDQLEEKISKLPKWAQVHISVLQSNLAVARKEVVQGWSDTIRSDTKGSSEVFCQSRAKVTFKLSDRRSIEVCLKEMDGKKSLHVYAEGGTLVIKPEISNVVDITVVSHFDGKED